MATDEPIYFSDDESSLDVYVVVVAEVGGPSLSRLSAIQEAASDEGGFVVPGAASIRSGGFSPYREEHTDEQQHRRGGQRHEPTGRVHLGNYLGMIRPVLRLAAEHEAYVFVADGHALTTVEDPAELPRLTRELAAVLLALGLDPSRTALYRQSDVAEIFELAWILACRNAQGSAQPGSRLQVRGGCQPGNGRPADEGLSAGLFTYPILMAADILSLAGTAVPVGADQTQHLEVTRDVAVAFNRSYGPVLTLPEAVVDEDVALIPGTDGRKMSKSYDNIIPILAPPEEMGRLVRGIVTDSRRPEEPKDPGTCALYGLYRHVAAPEEAQALAERYASGGVGYGEVKAMLTEALVATFAAARQRYQALIDDPPGLDALLFHGAERAKVRVRDVVERVRSARGLAA